MDIVFTFISLILVLVAAYFFTKWYASGQRTRMQASSLQIMDQLMLDRDKRLVVLKIQDHYYASILSRTGATQLVSVPYTPEAVTAVHPFHENMLKVWLAKGGKQDETP